MAHPHKNILLLIADDLGKYVGAYGCKSVKTPSIDKLAAEGSRFDLAFASTASCSGSRSTIYTGLHTHENGQYGLTIYRTHFQTFSNIDTAPKLLNQADYLSGIIGKVHVGPDEVYPWTWRRESESRDVAWVADQADEFFFQAKAEDKPFYLTVGFVDPHRDVSTRGEFGNGGPFDARVKDLQVDAAAVEVPSWLSDLPETREELSEYYKAVNRTDQGVGLILDALERQGLTDNTLVIFTSDNGPPFINAKTTLYDAGTCLPLIVKRPGSKQGVVNPNLISFIDLLPTVLDWAGLETPGCGGPVQEAIRSPPRLGRSFLSIIGRGDVLPETEWQHHIFCSHTFHELHNYWPTRVLRTRRYKYHRNIAWRLDFSFASDLYASYTFEGIRNASKPAMIGSRPLTNYLFRPSEELFDLENDPDELNNLAQDAEHGPLLRKLRLILEKWQKQTRDVWLYRDGGSVLLMSRYGKDNLMVPDRFDIDVEEPGTTGVTMIKVQEELDLREIM